MQARVQFSQDTVGTKYLLLLLRSRTLTPDIPSTQAQRPATWRSHHASVSVIHHVRQIQPSELLTHAHSHCAGSAVMALRQFGMLQSPLLAVSCPRACRSGSRHLARASQLFTSTLPKVCMQRRTHLSRHETPTRDSQTRGHDPHCLLACYLHDPGSSSQIRCESRSLTLNH